MPIIVHRSTYFWLQSLGILQSQQLSSQMEVLYDDQIYLENGYLIAQLLKKILSKQASQPLYKVRKIATLMSFQNWEIIQSVLQQEGYDINQINWNEQMPHASIAIILEYLFEKYAPQQAVKRKYKTKKKELFFDLHGFDATKNYEDAENSLQFMCLLLCSSFSISPEQALGLLIQECKFIKILIRNGSKKNDFESVKQLYSQFMNNIQLFSQAIIQDERQHLQYFLQGLSQGVISESEQVNLLCCNMFSKLNQPDWLYSKGIKKMFLSPHKSTFGVLLSLLHPNYKSHLNQDLHNKFKTRKDFLQFGGKMLRFLPNHLHRGEIIDALKINYYVQQALLTFDIDSQQPLIYRILSRQILMLALQNFQTKISLANISKINQIAFSFNHNLQKSYQEQFHLLATLFTIIEVQLMKQLIEVEPFFKNAVKFLSSPFPQIRQFALANVIQLYKKLVRLFPLACFLNNYIPNSIGQYNDYSAMQLVSLDYSILKDQTNKALQICTSYYYFQVHCRCFIQIIKKLSSKKQSIGWANSNISKILSEWPSIQSQQQQKINQLANIKPKPIKQKNKFGYVGVKRKQMLHSNHYENYCRLLSVITELQDKKFLLAYYQKIEKYLQNVKKISTKNKCLVFLKNLLKKIKIKYENAREIPEIVPNYSTVSRSRVTQQQRINKIRLQTQEHHSQQDSSIQHLSKSQHSSSHEKNDQNQFLTEQMELNFEANLKIKKDNDNIVTERQTILLPFTQDQKIINQSQHPFYEQANLQQYQAIYIKMLMQKHQDIIQQCLQIYLQDSAISVKEFLSKINCDKIIDSKKMAHHWHKCKVYYESEPKQLIQHMLVQLGFGCFAFKKSKRIVVTSLQSFFQFLQKALQQKNLNYVNKTNSKKQQEKKQETYQIGKSMAFQFHISNKIRPLNQFSRQRQISIEENQFTAKKAPSSQSFMICFAALSDIYFQAMGNHLMEPMSKIISQMIIPNKKQKQPKDQQLQQLQKIVQQQQLASKSIQQSSYVTNRSNKFKKRQKKSSQPELTKSYLVAQSQNFEQIKSQNNKLRQKLMKRKQLLQSDMKKKYSIQDNSSKQIDVKAEEKKENQ